MSSATVPETRATETPGFTRRATETRTYGETGHRDTETQRIFMHDGLHASLTEQIIGCAMEVHRHLGPGLLESIYESALCFELTTAELVFNRQIGVPLFYKGMLLSEHRPDLVVDEAVIVEVRPSNDWTGFTPRRC